MSRWAWGLVLASILVLMSGIGGASASTEPPAPPPTSTPGAIGVSNGVFVVDDFGPVPTTAPVVPVPSPLTPVASVVVPGAAGGQELPETGLKLLFVSWALLLLGSGLGLLAISQR